MMHSRRLMDMAREIALGLGINVRRDNAQELIDIRKGKIDLQTLIDQVEKEIVEIDGERYTVSCCDYSESISELIKDGVLYGNNQEIVNHIVDDITN